MKKLKLEHYILIATIVFFAIAVYLSQTSPLAKALRNGELINALIIGTDWVDYARHSDTLIFANYDPAERFLTIVSIPRDTRYSPKGYNLHRINEVYAYFYRTTKNDRLASNEVRVAVEELLGNKVKIPYFIQIDYSSFKQFIDLIGGINIEIEEPMDYDDKAGNLHIHFSPGITHLDGDKALEYVRFRGKAGDVGRIFRQQRFFKSVVSKMKNPIVILRLPKIISIITKDICTNLTFWDTLVAVFEVKDLEANKIRLAQLPGYPRGDYWEIDHENCDGLLDKIFPSTSTIVAQGPKIKIEVWNASGQNKLAEKVNRILRRQGFDVIDWGTFNVIQKKTLIKDLTGDLRSAQRIAELIECGEVVTRYDSKRYVDISVILGEDCKIDEEHF